MAWVVVVHRRAAALDSARSAREFCMRVPWGRREDEDGPKLFKNKLQLLTRSFTEEEVVRDDAIKTVKEAVRHCGGTCRRRPG